MNNSNLPIDKVVEEIIDEFEFFEDWEVKFESDSMASLLVIIWLLRIL